MQHDFHYISKHSPEVREAYGSLMELLSEVHHELKQYTFQHKIVGSYSYNMITYDAKSNIGFDFDVNIYPHDEDNVIKPKDLRKWLKAAIDKCAQKYGFDFAEDSTRVLTIKVKDRKHSRIVYSVDFCIVNDYTDDDGDEHQKYVRFNKKHNSYEWDEQSDGYYMLPEKIEWLKDNGLWNDAFRKLYIDKKNSNTDPYVHSRTVFANTVHEVCQKNGFFDGQNTFSSNDRSAKMPGSFLLPIWR